MTRSLVRRQIHDYEVKTDRCLFQIYQPTPYISRVTENNVPYSTHKRRKKPSTGGKPPVSGLLPEQRICKETMSIKDRKRHFIYTRDASMKDRMKTYVNDVYRLFDDSRSEDNCWLHPSPPVRKNGRPAGSIQCEFKWNDSENEHAHRVNFGIVALIINHHLTGAQKEGFVNNAWHLSHLCGNWTCCNWRHMTVESAGINVGRNVCFPAITPCSHDPPCMKDRKRQLLVTLDISEQIKGAIRCTRNFAKPTPGCQIIYVTAPASDCGICGDGVACCNYRICHSLTSIMKSTKALEKLELCSHPNEDILKAITHLKWIIADLIREKGASDTTFLYKAVARRGLTT